MRENSPKTKSVIKQVAEELLAMPIEQLQDLLAESTEELKYDAVFADFLMQNFTAPPPMKVGDVIKYLSEKLQLKDAQIELGLQDYELNNIWQCDMYTIRNNPVYNILLNSYCLVEDLSSRHSPMHSREVYNYPAFVNSEIRSLKDMVTSDKFDAEYLLSLSIVATNSWRNGKF